ncbi:MAG: type II toxin-antitoxin system RelE/ParE family toxin [Hyphomicrobiaceae bacterium]
MRIYKTKGFARFARQERIGDEALCDAISRVERGLVDADLGGGVIKQRIPRKGQGRSGGFRTIVLYRIKDRAVFVDGFAKSSQDNIDGDDLELFRELAADFLSYDGKQIGKLIKAGAWIEVECDGDQP